MKVIVREMISKENITEKESSSCCQASFNSDGNITLRNYSGHNKNSDEIIILSINETQAIIKLFSEMRNIFPNSLPF